MLNNHSSILMIETAAEGMQAIPGLEAFNKRGNGDFLGSKDIEDIVTVLDGILHLQDILTDNNNATTFVKGSFGHLLSNDDFIQSLTGHVENGDVERVERIYMFLKHL